MSLVWQSVFFKMSEILTLSGDADCHTILRDGSQRHALLGDILLKPEK